MTKIQYEGVVSIEENPKTVSIGDNEIVYDLQFNGKFAGRPVTVVIADERFTGDMEIDSGMEGFSEWTPGDPSKWKVGGHDLLEVLEMYEGQRIVLWVSDEPINVLDHAPSWVEMPESQ